MIYFTAKDSKARLTVLNPVDGQLLKEDYTILVTTDDTSMSAFDCELIRDTTKINCIFSSNGPNVYRIIFLEDDTAGLVQSTKSFYEIYDDNYPIKTVFNDKFLVLLTMSPSNSVPRLLIYRYQEADGGRYLWSGLNYDSWSDRDVTDIELSLQDNDILVFNTNSRVNGKTLIKYVKLNPLTIKLKATDIKELKKYNVKANGIGSGIETSTFPLAHFFLHKDEQKDTNPFQNAQWYHWIIMALFFGVVYALIYLKWTKEKLRKENIKFSAMSNEVTDNFNITF